MGEQAEIHTEGLGPIDLLIVQASPFCNISCSYCYLPDRNSKKRIAVNTVLAAVARVVEAGLVRQRLTIVWHAGEPLAVPIQFYREVFRAIAQVSSGYQVRHTFQTNAILLSEQWIALIKEYNVRVGVSIDGPQFIHDAQRRGRSGEGTFVKVMRGIEVLRSNLVDFYTISVLSDLSLGFSNEIFDFFSKERFTRVGLNLEEAEGVHKLSSLHIKDQYERVKNFFETFYRRYRLEKPSFVVREFSQIENLISSGRFRQMASCQQSTPLRIVSVDNEGGFSTFAPELLTMSDNKANGFVFGNVHTDSLRNVFSNARFLAVQEAINRGVRQCAAECAYFPVCGGGSPSNKFSETGRLDISETRHCRLRFQALPESVIGVLEQELEQIMM